MMDICLSAHINRPNAYHSRFPFSIGGLCAKFAFGIACMSWFISRNALHLFVPHERPPLITWRDAALSNWQIDFLSTRVVNNFVKIFIFLFISGSSHLFSINFLWIAFVDNFCVDAFCYLCHFVVNQLGNRIQRNKFNEPKFWSSIEFNWIRKKSNPRIRHKEIVRLHFKKSSSFQIKNWDSINLKFRKFRKSSKNQIQLKFKKVNSS